VNANPVPEWKLSVKERVADSAGDRPHPLRNTDFAVLWAIVTALWTVATVLRIHRVWVPEMGWSTVLASVYTWISLLLPPWMFAIVLLGVTRLAAARQRSGR
jgi:hypothetical protein